MSSVLSTSNVPWPSLLSPFLSVSVSLKSTGCLGRQGAGDLSLVGFLGTPRIPLPPRLSLDLLLPKRSPSLNLGHSRRLNRRHEPWMSRFGHRTLEAETNQYIVLSNLGLCFFFFF
jgi:hypothetical protein